MPQNTYLYLQFHDRLTQIWLNKYTLVLILAALKLLMFLFSIKSSLNIAQAYVLANCDTIDNLYAQAIEDTPYYIAKFGNYMIKESMEGSVKATLTVLSLLVYSSEELFKFLIDLYLGTYECLIVSAIDGTVDVATNATEKLISYVNGSISTLANDLDNGLDDISELINKVLKVADKVENFLTGDDDDDESQIASVNLTISALRNLYIPSSINDKLEALSAKTPSFSEVKNKTQNLIAVPFEKVRNEISDIDVSKIVGNPTNLYVPSTNTSDLSVETSICSPHKAEIVSFFQDLSSVIRITVLVFVILLILGAFAMMIPEWWEEKLLWTKLYKLDDSTYSGNTVEIESSSDEEINNPFNDKNHIKTNNRSDSDFGDVIKSYFECFNPWHNRVYCLFTKISSSLSFLRRSETNTSDKPYLRWTILYVTSERALLILGIGLLGLLVCIVQLITISILNSKLNAFEQNSSMLSLSANSSAVFDKNLELWGNQTNIYINDTQTNINEQVFGWVDTTTKSLNETVTDFIDDIDDALADLFNGTLLYSPMKSVVSCVIESKLYAISNSLTWINEKAEVTLPRVNITEIKDVIVASNTSGTTQNVVERITADTLKFIRNIIKMYKQSVEIEVEIVCAILGIWLLQIPIALLILYFK
ncbi:hypothetical protein TPHA_0F00270 [Tetrapisispora phaffii CBS 4417]|uniref:Plasma membrane fusion protein PRM1 n=1 Tax=Tetrapisispora phaffii (strain ATCC 24235 / CBS 4417 / NBRC 1672 / NRRL Y-8282 / UCD 70-5) TaxID=1071381 RepID=G8BUT2_TETPH|nr:hypothetical protein TPHA_0F00270 [Tetrapisispora phaffii CBS 4417]CCE63514.1 hypothetical protein TPHA_0F00270 [Tetrapisispora phaffii CBS 4417]